MVNISSQKKMSLSVLSLICSFLTLLFLIISFLYMTIYTENLDIILRIPIFWLLFSIISMMVSVLSMAFEKYNKLNSISLAISILVVCFFFLGFII